MSRRFCETWEARSPPIPTSRKGGEKWGIPLLVCANRTWLLCRRFYRCFFGRSFRFRLAACHVFVHAEAPLDIVLRVFPQFFCMFRMALGQHLEARLLQQPILHFAAGRA